MSAEIKLTIQQSIHGYDKGHRLLSSSFELPKDIQSNIAHKSDASVSGYGKNSPSYLTGYPIPEISKYCLARTWPDPNKPRPGCVFTHSLFIDFTDLAQLSSLEFLQDLFAFKSCEDFDSYSEAIEIKSVSKRAKIKQLDGTLLKSVLIAVYENINSETIFPWSPEADNYAIKIWEQQWPKLRRSFKFKTYGSHSLNKNEYDLVFSDKSYSISQLTKHDIEGETKSADWLKLASDDIIKAQPELRNFLKKYGTDFKVTKSAYKPLMTYWSFLQSQKGNLWIDNVWDYALKQTNTPVSLVMELIEHALQINTKDKVTSFAKWMLNYMLDMNWEALSSQQLNEISILLKDIAVPDFIRILKASKNDKLSNALIHSQPTKKLLKALESDGSLYESLYTAMPTLAYEANFWSKDRPLPNNILLDIQENKLSGKKVLISILNKDALDLAPKIISTVGEDSILIVLQYLNKLSSTDKNEINIIDEWLNLILAQNWNIFENISRIKLPSLEFIQLLARKFSSEKSNFSKGPDVWQKAVENSDDVMSEDYAELAVFLLIRALEGLDKNSENLFKISFDVVHQLLSEGRLDYQLWRKLDRLLPSSSLWFMVWDKCERLRRGVLRSYIKHNLPAETLLQITETDEVKFSLVKSSSLMSDSKDLIHQAVKSYKHKASD